MKLKGQKMKSSPIVDRCKIGMRRVSKSLTRPLTTFLRQRQDSVEKSSIFHIILIYVLTVHDIYTPTYSWQAQE